MGITVWSGRGDEQDQISVEEFKKWLKRFDGNKDGRITVEELRQAIRSTGAWFSTWKARRGLKIADENSDGAIDENEISNLVVFAQKNMGLKIV